MSVGIRVSWQSVSLWSFISISMFLGQWWQLSTAMLLAWITICSINSVVQAKRNIKEIGKYIKKRKISNNKLLRMKIEINPQLFVPYICWRILSGCIITVCNLLCITQRGVRVRIAELTYILCEFLITCRSFKFYCWNVLAYIKQFLLLAK